METVVSQYVSYIGHHHDFFRNCICSVSVAYFLEIIRKHVFTTSNIKIMKNRGRRTKFKKVLQEEIGTNFVKENTDFRFKQ